MPGYDFRSPRQYVEAPLGEGASVPLDRAQAHYLGTVLRLKSGGRVLVFNGRDGEWSATLVLVKRTAALDVGAKRASKVRRRICTICLLRSRPRGSITWCKKPSKWASRGYSR